MTDEYLPEEPDDESYEHEEQRKEADDWMDWADEVLVDDEDERD